MTVCIKHTHHGGGNFKVEDLRGTSHKVSVFWRIHKVGMVVKRLPVCSQYLVTITYTECVGSYQLSRRRCWGSLAEFPDQLSSCALRENQINEYPELTNATFSLLQRVAYIEQRLDGCVTSTSATAVDIFYRNPLPEMEDDSLGDWL